MSYPVFLNIKDLPCLVVGGGRVGLRKTLGLVDAGARVRVIEPRPSENLLEMEKNGQVQIKAAEFVPEDLGGMRLVFAATQKAEVNALVAQEAGKLGIWCNIADDPSGSDFFLPALVKRGDLMLAISTGGKSPALARKLRMDLEKIFDAAYLPFLELMGRLREILLAEGHDPEGHRDLFRSLVEGPLLEYIRMEDMETVALLLEPIAGADAMALAVSVIKEHPARKSPEKGECFPEKEGS
ncbi:precorrin-2 dehydrogenase/sirohydrochlorin ferrochelatase family protein [Desulfobotulus mexicanus]|uniref:precorrin-2 dehydrogenase/sirohydrochlorin ferrochelatase family protein n=1 Tax=Desulfobotulus mexicanus TaxID=2586642 RepID=UPI0015D2CA49|nr:bifunctional precorrin-2 dehydrogenase/sirohydrochlorin ferrochelatase [Desulfobotulus mexicanus]